MNLMAPFFFFGLFNCSQKCPSQAVSIRAICPEKYTVINQATNEVIEEVEESKAFFEVGANGYSHSQSDNWVHVSLLDDLSITQAEWIDWVESLTAVSVVVCLDLLEKLFGINTIVFIELLFFFPFRFMRVQYTCIRARHTFAGVWTLLPRLRCAKKPISNTIPRPGTSQMFMCWVASWYCSLTIITGPLCFTCTVLWLVTWLLRSVAVVAKCAFASSGFAYDTHLRICRHTQQRFQRWSIRKQQHRRVVAKWQPGGLGFVESGRALMKLLIQSISSYLMSLMIPRCFYHSTTSPYYQIYIDHVIIKNGNFSMRKKMRFWELRKRLFKECIIHLVIVPRLRGFEYLT